jgi:hypothetical protein
LYPHKGKELGAIFSKSRAKTKGLVAGRGLLAQVAPRGLAQKWMPSGMQI